MHPAPSERQGSLLKEVMTNLKVKGQTEGRKQKKEEEGKSMYRLQVIAWLKGIVDVTGNVQMGKRQTFRNFVVSHFQKNFLFPVLHLILTV